MKKIFFQSFEALKRIKSIIIIVAIFTIISLGIGIYFSQSSSILIMGLKNQIIAEIKNFKPIQDISQAVFNKNIVYAIGYTAVFNLASGAFLSTTLFGLIFPLPILVMVERGLLIGFVYGGISGNVYYYIVLLGTIILEFGAYIISSAVGVNIGLSLFWPKKFATNNRWIAFKRSWIEAVKIYPIIFLVLIISAIWEIGGVYLITK